MSDTSKRILLDSNAVWKHVNQVLDEVNPSLREKLGISLRPITDWKGTSGSKIDLPLYFGIEIVSSGGEQNSGGEQKTDQASFLSFYVGYSTWEGLCVFVDQLREDKDPNDQLYLQVLAKICLCLGSRRLTWKRCYPPVPSWYQANKSVGPPDILVELHALHMDQDAMRAYVNFSEPPSTSSSNSISLNRSLMEEQSRDAILEASSNKNTKFTMRLAEASNVGDAQAMESMVKGLAIYVKEPLEDIHCNADDYLIDGSGNHPLYYTFLLETSTDANEKQVCGIAVVYFGYSYKSSGRYLYLEDLYVDQAYQHQGAGSLALRMLTILALKMNCESFQWLALDWNKPALDLYQNKIGAKIQEGKKVSRYTGSKLKDFADAFLSTLAAM